MKHRFQIAILPVLFTLFSSPLCFAEAPAAPKKVVTVEGITEYGLDNGLRVLLYPDQSTPNVTVVLTVMVGSRHEGYGETGMAHLLEHLQFKGTPTHRDIPKELKDRGAQFNATTSLDRTNYFETLQGTDDNLEFALGLESDRLLNSFIRREDLTSEMTVVRNEFEMGENSPDRVLNQRMLAVAYEWHNYGKSTIGNRSDIERVPIDRLQEFYRKYYQIDNCMLAIGGKFDEKTALNLVTKYFGSLKKPRRKLDATYTEEPPQDGERTVILRRVGKVGVVGTIYHIPAAAHADMPAADVLGEILVEEPSGRLYKALVESKKASSVRGGAEALHDPGVFEFVAQVPNDKSLDDVRDTMLNVLEKLAAEKVTAEEVERAKRKLLKDHDLMMTRTGAVTMQLGEWQAKGDWRLLFLHRDGLAKVTAEDVDRVAAQYLLRNNRTVGMYIPTDKAERTSIPETPSIAELVKDYKGKAGLAAGESFEPTPENIEKRVQRSQLPVGFKLALLPKKTRGGTVVVHLVLHYGNEESLRGHTSAAQFLGPLMLRGTKKHTRQQIKDDLDKLGARMSAGGGGGLLLFNIEAKRKTLPDVLKLLGEIIHEPTFPQDEFDVLKRERLTTLEKGSTEPIQLAITELQRRLSPYPDSDVRYAPTIQESMARIKNVTALEVGKLYTDQLSAQVGEMAIVGDFDTETTPKLVDHVIGDWKSDVAFQRIPRPANTEVQGSKAEILTPDKANAVYLAGEVFAMNDSDPDYAALRIADFLFGGGALSNRLGNRVRQKEGLSYTIQAILNADSIDKSAQLLVFAIANPANIDKVDKAVMEEFDKMIKDGATRDEVAKSKEGFLKQQKLQRTSDSALATILASGLFEGRTFAYYADLDKKIEGLTVQDVNNAFRKHVAPKKLTVIKAGDFKAKAKTTKAQAKK